MSKLTASQKETLAIFTSGADKLEIIVAGLSEKELDYSTAPGEWTIRQIFHHLTGDGDAWSKPFWRAIASSGATISRDGFAGTGIWVDALTFNKCPVQTALIIIKTHRKLLAGLAEYFPDAWEQCITILDAQGQERQKISAGQIIRMLGEHLAEHVATIEAIKRQHGI